MLSRFQHYLSKNRRIDKRKRELIDELLSMHDALGKMKIKHMRRLKVEHDELMERMRQTYRDKSFSALLEIYRMRAVYFEDEIVELI